MNETLRAYLNDRLTGALAIALILFAVLVLSGGPDETSAAADGRPVQTATGAQGPYHTLDAY